MKKFCVAAASVLVDAAECRHGECVLDEGHPTHSQDSGGGPR